MSCPRCRSATVMERPERTAQGYRRFRCQDCTKQFNERSSGSLDRTQYPSDVIALVVLWRLRYKLSLRDLVEMFLIRGIVFSYEAVRDWEAKLTPALAEDLRRSRKGKVGRSWYLDETYIRVQGEWKYLYRAIDRDGALVDVMLSEHRDLAAVRAYVTDPISTSIIVWRDHRGIKGRCRPILGFKSVASAKRFVVATTNFGIFCAVDRACASTFQPPRGASTAPPNRDCARYP